MTSARTVRVPLGARSYDVRIGAGLLAQLGPACAALGARRIGLVTDAQVAPLWLEPALASLRAAGLQAMPLCVPPGEDSKSFLQLEHLCAELLRAGLDRQDLVVALGGGVVGDLAGFAAGVLKRGVGFVQVPTTLLAQVDSSVGGKTGINTKAGKNLIGLFHQPRLVLADSDTLATLPRRELRAGFAEVIKYGLIDDPQLFAWCEAHGEAALSGDASALLHAVEASVAAKARTVAADEHESTGQRALLNLGHTFGHALEAIAGYDGRLLHGEAVAAGMALAFRFSVRQGMCPAADAARVERLLTHLGYAWRLQETPGGPYTTAAMLEAMRHDKKNTGEGLSLILARGIGQSCLEPAVAGDTVKLFLQQELAGP